KDPEERDRLRDIMKNIKPKNFGVIIRTVAKNKKIEEIDQDLKDLLDKWKKIHKNLINSKPPRRILGEINKASSLLRDLLNANFTNIHVNNEDLFEKIKSYVASIAPDKEQIVKNYNGKLDIFEKF